MKKNIISKIVACVSIALVVGVVVFFALKNENSEEKTVDTAQNNAVEEKESTEAEEPVQKTESALDLKYSLIGKNLSKIDNDMEECDAYSDGVYKYEFAGGTNKLVAIMAISEDKNLASDNMIGTVSDYIKNVYPSWNLNPDNWKIAENEAFNTVNYYCDDETVAVSFMFDNSGKLMGGNIYPTSIDSPAPNSSGKDISEEEAISLAKNYIEEYIAKEKSKGVVYVPQDFSTYEPSVKINHKGDKDYWYVTFEKSSEDTEVFEPYHYVCELYMNGDLSYVDKA